MMMLATAAKSAMSTNIHSLDVSGLSSATYGANIVATLAKVLQNPNEAATMEVGKS